MDARVLLRRYLEQRRELGESEMVLDALTVEDVMRLLGATGRAVPSDVAPLPSVRELAGEPSTGLLTWSAQVDFGRGVPAGLRESRHDRHLGSEVAREADPPRGGPRASRLFDALPGVVPRSVIDEDLGLSGKVFVKRSGFDHLNAEVALGRVGILLGLEVSRLARSNADWYRLLDMCAITDTLLADSDGVYHPALFNDRLILGLKGTMSEAELHVLRQRLDGGLRNKAARGELRRALPVGLIWGEKEGEVRFHPDEAVTGCMRTIFAKFTELGSARQVWLWFRSEKLSFPQHPSGITAVQLSGLTERLSAESVGP